MRGNGRPDLENDLRMPGQRNLPGWARRGAAVDEHPHPLIPGAKRSNPAARQRLTPRPEDGADGQMCPAADEYEPSWVDGHELAVAMGAGDPAGREAAGWLGADPPGYEDHPICGEHLEMDPEPGTENTGAVADDRPPRGRLEARSPADWARLQHKGARNPGHRVRPWVIPATCERGGSEDPDPHLRKRGTAQASSQLVSSSAGSPADAMPARARGGARSLGGVNATGVWLR